MMITMESRHRTMVWMMNMEINGSSSVREHLNKRAKITILTSSLVIEGIKTKWS